MEKRRTIAIDFDGVISNYQGYKGKGNFAPPVPGCKNFLDKLREEGWTIIVFTTRSEIPQIEAYMLEFRIPYDYINENPENKKLDCSPWKILADIYLDDRAICFEGVYSKELLTRIIDFQPWGNNDRL